jgi:GT2 family glycosyltransferase
MTPPIKISFSLVIYKHSYSQIAELLDSIQKVKLDARIFVVDNSPTDKFQTQIPPDSKIEYIIAGKNLGYGSGHNLVIRKLLNWSDYHVVLNPDILVTEETILAMVNYIDKHPNIGLLMPKVLYPSGEIQYLCKRFPTPFDLIMRRFIPSFLAANLKERMNRYELKHKDYNQSMEVPNLSGCFMLLRTEVLRIVGVFDERFFMYLEDTDLSRRINMQFQTMYYPEVSIIHQYEKGSYKNLRLLKYHIVSAFKYFNKYGWFFDTVRSTINRRYN